MTDQHDDRRRGISYIEHEALAMISGQAVRHLPPYVVTETRDDDGMITAHLDNGMRELTTTYTRDPDGAVHFEREFDGYVDFLVV